MNIKTLVLIELTKFVKRHKSCHLKVTDHITLHNNLLMEVTSMHQSSSTGGKKITFKVLFLEQSLRMKSGHQSKNKMVDGWKSPCYISRGRLTSFSTNFTTLIISFVPVPFPQVTSKWLGFN